MVDQERFSSPSRPGRLRFRLQTFGNTGGRLALVGKQLPFGRGRGGTGGRRIRAVNCSNAGHDMPRIRSIRWGPDAFHPLGVAASRQRLLLTQLDRQTLPPAPARFCPRLALWICKGPRVGRICAEVP